MDVGLSQSGFTYNPGLGGGESGLELSCVLGLCTYVCTCYVYVHVCASAMYVHLSVVHVYKSC